MISRVTVPLDSKLLLQAKRKAVAEGRSLNSVIVEGLRHAVAETEEAMLAARRGELVTVGSPDRLLAELNADD